MIALDAVGAAGIEQGRRADHVCAHKDLRIRDAAVHVGLRRKVNHNVRLLLLKEVKDKRSVRDVAAHKAVVLLVRDRRNALQIARIGEEIQVDDLILRIAIHLVLHEVAADKTCAACHYYFHLSPVYCTKYLPSRTSRKYLPYSFFRMDSAAAASCSPEIQPFK